ncbi:MAG: SDR family NAD(P)-dependent oxidoreductase [Gemmataceae bacterium]
MTTERRPANSSSTPTPPCDIAIVGIGCLFPKSAGTGWFWANVKKGVDCIGDVPSTHWNPDDYFDEDPKAPDMTYARRGGFLDPIDFNPMEFGIAPRDLEATDTTQLLGLVAAKQALADAKISFRDDTSSSAANRAVDRSRVSVILGVTGTLELVVPLGARLGHPKWRRAMKDAGIPDDLATDAVGRISESYVPWQENSFPGLLGNVVAGRIANRLDLHGTNCVVDAACASSLSAIHLATMELALGRADVVVSGGADTFNDIFMFMCFSKTPALSASGNSKPFDANGDGTILGEGIGTVVLKRRADAERDGDRIYAVIKAIGTSSDGKGNAIYAPSADGQVRCLTNAYSQAGVTPDTIELVEAHGTGTKVGDGVEATALTKVFSQGRGTRPTDRPWCALGSVKSQIGHTKAAAGVAGLIKATLSLYNKVLPPTIKVTLPVEPLRAADSPFYINSTARPWLPRREHPRRAGLSAFGFGGSNFHCVLEEASPVKAAPDWDGSVEIMALSGSTRRELSDRLNTVPTAWTEFARAAESSRNSFSPTAQFRLLLVAEKVKGDVTALLDSAKAKLNDAAEPREWFTPDGAYFGSGSAPGTLAVLFPGQGSQSIGMLRDLVNQFPEPLESLALANEAKLASGVRITDTIYPPTSFLPDAIAQQTTELTRTDHAQPALGAVEWAAWNLLVKRFHVRADAFAGHSFGELTALAAANRISPNDFFRLAVLRGQLMAEQRGQSGEGEAGMSAVIADAATVESIIAQSGSDATIANRNGPRQTVISAAISELEKLEMALKERSIRFIRLPVSSAFHSRFVAAATVPFRTALDSVTMTSSSIPVYANTTAAVYPSDPASARDLLGHQLAKPVLFDAEIRAMVAAGVRTFVEVGPGGKLARMTAEILTTEPALAEEIACLSIDSSGGKRSGLLDLAHCLARLAARGYVVSLTAWERESGCRPLPSVSKPGLTIPICGANYVSPRTVRTPAKPANVMRSVNIENSTMPEPVRPNPESPALTAALEASARTLAALQQLQEQTASLHRQFLESQHQAQQTIAALVAQQQSALGITSVLPPNHSTDLTSSYTPAYLPPPRPRIPEPAPVPTFAPSEKPGYYSAPATTATTTSASTSRPAVSPETVVRPAATVATPSPAPAPAADLAKPAGRSASIDKVLLEVVSEKTGYPVETLDLSMSLDADLGVDSIKRVEILSSLQDRLPNAPVVKPEQLGTLHTLGDVSAFLSAGTAVAEVASAASAVVGSLAAGAAASGCRSSPRAAHKTLPLSKLSSAATIHATASELAELSAQNRYEWTNEISKVLLEVVSEKTGYPAETLDLNMSMDNDLGIDSIKRVEILSTIQERLPNTPAVKPEQLGTIHTLMDLVNYLSGTPNPATAKIPISPSELISSPAPAPSTSRESSIFKAVRPTESELLASPTETISSIRQAKPSDSILLSLQDPTREASASASSSESSGEMSKPLTTYPSYDPIDRSVLQTVDIDLHIARPRVAIPEGRELLIIADDGAFSREVIRQFHSLGYTTSTQPWSAATTAKIPDELSGLILVSPRKSTFDSSLNRNAFQWIQRAGAKIHNASHTGGTGVIASISFLDGAFGISTTGPEFDPAMGGLAGLVKTIRHEWPELSAKAIDIDPMFVDANPNAAALAAAEESLTSGPVEVGINSKHRFTLDLARTVRRSALTAPLLGSQDIFLVTGGGRGVTAEAAIALAASTKGTIILTGRTPPPPANDPDWIAGITDDAAMKRAAMEHLGPTATPRAVFDLVSRTVSHREIRETMNRITAAGAKVAYYSVNVSQGRAIADILHQIRVKYGSITVLVHGAGVLADKRVEQLTVDQFDAVFGTKAEGARNLLELLRAEELKAIVFFGSTTGRYGRIGQIAYASANEVLNKLAQSEARRRPHCRVVCINWGPWEGGMVTPALKKVFESEGIGLVPLIEGGQFVVNELASSGRSVEIVAMGKLRGNVITTPNPNDYSNRMSTRINPVSHLPNTMSPPLTAPPAPELSLAFERVIDITSHPILRSHVLDGRAVLPMAIHMEWLAHAALHGNPGLGFLGVDNLRVTSGIQIDDGATVPIKALAGRAVKQDKVFVVPVELRGRRKDGREVIHSRAEVLLTASLPRAPQPDRVPEIQAYPHPVDEVYKYFLFHGPDLHGIERVDGMTETAFVGSAYPAPAPTEWFAAPLRSNWVADPLVLDTSFQMLILWSFAQHGAGSLPCFAGRYRQFRRTFPIGSVKIVVRITRDNGTFARADIDFVDADGTMIAQLQDYECVIDAQLNMAFRRNQLAPKLARV